MMLVKHGNTEVKGEVEGFTPGSSTFEIDFGNGGKLVLEANANFAPGTFDKMRVSMNAIGLYGLKNSVIDFNKGTIQLVEGPVHKVKTKKNIGTAFVA